MDYNLKVIINGVEVLESTGSRVIGGVTYDTPSITNVTLQNSASLGAMDIGATACDKLVFTMLNPYKQSFDGDAVEFWIAETDSNEESTFDKIIAEVGDDTANASIDIVENDSDISEDEEEGEAMTSEELDDVAATEDINEEALFIQLEGEADDTLATETIEEGWVSMGVYYVMGQVSNPDGSVTITAYDGFCKLNDLYNPPTTTGTVQAMFDELREQTLANSGITINEFDFDEIAGDTITLNVLTTYRGALGFFAGLVGGFAEFDTDGSVSISFYSFTSNELIRSELFSYSEDSAGEMILQELTCNTSIVDVDEITVGAGQGVSFTNPFMTEVQLEKILDTYKGMRFVGGNISAIWDKSLMAGRFVRIFTEDEYANYIELLNQIEVTTSESALKVLKAGANSLGSIMLICSQVIDFRGNATTRIVSGNGTEASKTNALIPPMIQKVIEAGKTATNYLSQDETGALVISNYNNDFNVRIDNDSVDIRKGETVIASYGDHITLGEEDSLEIYRDGISLGNTGMLTLPNPSAIRMANSEGDLMPIGNFAIESGVTSNGWVWSVLASQNGVELEAHCVDTTNSTTANTAFGSTGLYYKDSTKSIVGLLNELKAKGYYFRDWAAGRGVIIQATTNGNTGSGYVSVWRVSYDPDNERLNVRYVSNVSNAMGTITTTYSLRIGVEYIH